MNPIPLNDRGQFRYLDFVAYLPEFLREEPDVVELVQVMSDYINDGYRNIEDVEEFEFKLCVAEPKVERAKEALAKLRSMFDLASGRSDRVYYLSVPRANVKSNEVFGKNTGYTPYYVDVPLREVVDEITGIQSIDSKLVDMEDGDVVFVRYTAVEPPVTKAYYLSKDTKTLLADPEGTSQDPFTDTSNTGSRMISFNVSDISSIGTRYGGLRNGNTYFEVFFNARVSDVKSEPARTQVSFDADRIDESKDDVVVDYYGMNYVGNDKYYTTFAFHGNGGWAWKSGIPAGMFYLKDSSGAKLSAVGEALKTNEEMAEDPSLSYASERYALSKDATYDIYGGTWTFVTETAIPQVDDGRFYAVNTRTGKCVGEFICSSSKSADGEFATSMNAVWVEGYTSTIPKDEVILIQFPLFYSKGVPNYRSAVPIANWEEQASIGAVNVDSAVIYRAKNVGTVPVDYGTFEYDALDANDPMHSVYIPREVFSKLSADIAIGLPLFCENVLWRGIATVAKWKKDSRGGAVVTMAVTLDTSRVGNTVHLRSGMLGMISVTGETEGTVDNLFTTTDLLNVAIGSGSLSGAKGYVVCLANGNPQYLIIREVDQTTGKVTFDSPHIEPGYYAFYVMRLDKETGYVKEFGSVNRLGDDKWSGSCKRYRGDVYTGGPAYMYDGQGNCAFIEMGSEENPVSRFTEETWYEKGDIVYNPGDGKLYRCLVKIYADVGDTPDRMHEFRIERLANTHIEYTEVYNKFVPYYGPVKSMEFGGKVDYTGDMDIATLPLYITKVVENRLKYGWEHRDFLNYGTMMNMNGRDRNGSVDIFSSARSTGGREFETAKDVVTATLKSKARWNITYPVVKQGVATDLKVDIDNQVYVTAECVEGEWVVSVASAAHGLVEGALIRVTGFAETSGLNINGYYPVHVVDGDNISFSITDSRMMSTRSVINFEVSENTSIDYIGEYWADLVTVEKVAGESSVYQVAAANPLVGIAEGDVLTLVDLDADTGKSNAPAKVEVTVLSDSVPGDGVIRFTCGEDISAYLSDSFQLRRAAEEGDYVMVDDLVYLVGNGLWGLRDEHDLAIPSVLVSKQNLMDVSNTNPELALGEDIVVERIIPESADVAIVRIKEPLLHFTAENRSIIAGRTMVKITNASPSQYNGWHTVTDVVGPKAFRISVRLPEDDVVEAQGLNGLPIRMNEGRWYAFALNGVDWEKVSNRVTYSLDNKITSVSDGLVITDRDHGFAEGDYVVVGSLSDIVSVDAYNKDELTGISCYRVDKLNGTRGATLVNIDGTPATAVAEGVAIARGVLLTARRDDIGSLSGEYSRKLESLGGKRYRFTAGDIVIALAQQNPSEIKSWRVNKDGDWLPVRAKRSLKVSALGVYSYDNAAFDGTDVDSGEVAEKYETYSDVDVESFDADVYVAGYRCVSRPNFAAPALEDMDTTRTASLEYSSAEDFSTVSPRTNMKPGFKGIPSMKYPLVEKIERLCYLRDAHVIDFELIEYLARFLGYDITALGQDIGESSMYSTKAERELAVRETIANLPQYYSLGGTKSGIRMLLATFGVIADVLTLWTDANRPYSDMIHRDEVIEKVESGKGGKWVPTPYIDVVVTNDSRLPQFTARQGDIERIREQIRVFKPINVVFRDFIIKMVDTLKLDPMIYLCGAEVKTTAGVVVVTNDDTPVTVDYSDDELNNCAF